MPGPKPARAATAPREPEESGWDRVVEAFYRVPPLIRDLGIAVLIIVVILGGLWGYTGQPFPSQPPLVVVESGSMMHPTEDNPYGKFGTIDPGDLILVKDINGPYDVVTLHGSRATGSAADMPGGGGREGYGLGGDVVIYQQKFCDSTRTTPIIHRAVTWVEVRTGAGGTRSYSYHDADGNWLRDRPTVTLAGMHISQVDAFEHSGWITKGDNPLTNEQADQSRSSNICTHTAIRPEWVIGKARGEIPWIGLLKFIFQGNNVDPRSDWCNVGRAVAPCDTFGMLWVSLAILIAIPVVLDLALRKRREKDEEKFLERRREEDLDEERRPPREETDEAEPGAPRRREEGPPPEQRPRWSDRDDER
ncbi:MAG: S26 family signal peptidase [Euryarchaeota archaeon]|nr:S26 family signal peptidase [Euryarchaeota archaeon]